MVAPVQRLASDDLGSAVHTNLLSHLPGPFGGGAMQTSVPLAADGRIDVNWTTRRPLLLVSLKTPLGSESVRITPALDPAVPGAAVLAKATFAPYSEQGAAVLVHAPQTAVDVDVVAGFIVRITAERIDEDGTVTAVAGAALQALVEATVLEGTLARLLFVCEYEHARLRRMARELLAMRTLATARRDALDRMGADVGAERFRDEIAFDAASKEIVTRLRMVGGIPGAEPDADYARRLRLYRPFRLRTRRSLVDLLNGPGTDADPNAGLFSGIQGGHRFRVLEADNRIAVALHLIEVGPAGPRVNFLAQIRQDRLIWPSNTPAANTVHSTRFLPQKTRTEINQLRASLRQSFAFAASAAIAPHLVRTLDRAGRLGRALGFAKVWAVTRAQDGAAGSRYELGLGVDVTPPTAAEADDLRTRMLDPNQALPADAELAALVRNARSGTVPAVADDPELAWFWRLCGVQTVHRVDAATLFLSHFPMFGLVLSGATQTATGVGLPLEARYHAPGDPGKNVVLANGLAAAAAAWAADGGAAWTVLSDAQAQARWGLVPVHAPGDPANAVLAGAGLPVVTDPAPAVAALNQLPPELIETVRLDAAQAAQITAGQPAAIAPLAALAGHLRDNGMASVLPLIGAGNEVLLVVGVIGLPEAGINLNERRATGFRWYATPVGASGGAGAAAPGIEIKAIGSRTLFIARAPGVYVAVAVGYARTGLTDPYEFRVELPDKAVLSITEYEFLMNLLGVSHPIGVEINTFSIRREHVDLDGDGIADPLSPAVFRTFRAFQRRRLRGAYDVDPDPGSPVS